MLQVFDRRSGSAPEQSGGRLVASGNRQQRAGGGGASNVWHHAQLLLRASDILPDRTRAEERTPVPHWSPPSPAGPQQASASLGLRQGAPASLRPRGGLRGATAAAAASPLPAPTVSPPPPPSFPPLPRPAAALQGLPCSMRFHEPLEAAFQAVRNAALTRSDSGVAALSCCLWLTQLLANAPHGRTTAKVGGQPRESWRHGGALQRAAKRSLQAAPRGRGSRRHADHAHARQQWPPTLRQPHITRSAPRPARPASCWPSTSCRSSRGPAGWSAAPAPAASPC